MSMDKHTFDKHYTPATVIIAEGVRVGVVTCKLCWSAILLDPRDTDDAAERHTEWHDFVDAARKTK